ncbi:aquaporin-like protein [Mycoemilia scoparia]|uniref:Aquaporin-like protein n=1 Tax=Mycoemilia scoparia TaxID=417184 RepID=A0A9W8A6W6_9FUNG|nr:aquaporin-like protein [Mycoemilia scoparia]
MPNFNDRTNAILHGPYNSRHRRHPRLRHNVRINQNEIFVFPNQPKISVEADGEVKISEHETVHLELERMHTKSIIENYDDPQLYGISPTKDFQTYLAHVTASRNMPLYKIRSYLAEYIAEFFGTMLLVIFGNGVVATTLFNPRVAGSEYILTSFGWGLGLAFALYVTMGVSGGHLNPAISFALALFGKFPYSKFVGYCLAQILGALVGAAVVFGLYHGQISAFDGGNRQTLGPQGTGALFFSLPDPNNSRAQSVFSEILNTVLLMGIILAINDPRMTPAEGYKPIAIGLLLVSIGLSTGYVSGYAINPARDFGPRAFAAMVGYGKDPFTIYDHYFVIPMFCPFPGAVIGILLYELFIIPKDE